MDKIPGGARLGFITIGDGKTEVLVYIDCLVFPATDNSAPIFRAIRNGPSKDKAPPGEPRIMRSLLQALQKSVEIAKLWLFPDILVEFWDQNWHKRNLNLMYIFILIHSAHIMFTDWRDQCLVELSRNFWILNFSSILYLRNDIYT